jgi:hypothetical protein
MVSLDATSSLDRSWPTAYVIDFYDYLSCGQSNGLFIVIGLSSRNFRPFWGFNTPKIVFVVVLALFFKYLAREKHARTDTQNGGQ